jgi:glyoxalase family protein
MPSLVTGLHHVTATVDDAQHDLDFCVAGLGLRLVKRTVNFDNHHVYHFYYGDRVGTPGTIWTTFPYKGHGVRVGATGTGQVTATSFSVPTGSLEGWAARLTQRGWKTAGTTERFGERVLTAIDPSGLVIDLIGTARDPRAPWLGMDVTAEAAVRGVHSVTMTVASTGRTLAFMSAVLGFEPAGSEGDRTRMAVGGDAPGHYIDVVHAPGAPAGINGLGTVHHVAMAVTTAEDQLLIRQELLRLGVPVTEVRDRQYFQSIYFREPGGVLFEIATCRPGFAIDEPVDELGTHLKLPPWEEPYRDDIEAGLAPIAVPR